MRWFVSKVCEKNVRLGSGQNLWLGGGVLVQLGGGQTFECTQIERGAKLWTMCISIVFIIHNSHW